MKLKANGIEINYDKQGSGPVVTLSHSLASNHHKWDAEAKSLATALLYSGFAVRGQAGTWSLAAPDLSVERSRAHVTDRLTELVPIFSKQKFMLGDEFSMLDVAIAPMLWRLDHYGIRLGKPAAPLMKYAERIFSRPAFIEALTPSEKVMRK